jgi:hypothetical protein
MDIRKANINEIDILNTLWWLWCNEKINLGDVKYFIQDLDLQIEFITLDKYKFTNRDKTITYSYDRQQ